MKSAAQRRAERRLASSAPVSKTLFPIAVPLFAELALGIGVGVIGTAMAARLSDTSAAAYAMSNHLASMLFLLFRILGAGVGVVITQSIGGGHLQVADRVTRAVLGASTWIGVISALGAAFGATALFRLMNAPAEILPLGTLFLACLAPALLLDAWIATLTGVLRARLFNRPVLAVVVAMNLFQLALAWPFMFGAAGIDGIGLPGYALAQGLARLAALAALLWLAQARLKFHARLGDWFRWSRRDLAPVLRIGLPGAAENIGYRLAFMASLAAVGTLGASALATQAYVLQISYLALMSGLAIGLAMEIAMGHVAGARRLHHADRLLRDGLKLALVLSVIATTVSALLSPFSLRLFTDDPGAISLGITLLWLTVLLEPGRTFNLVVINALRAAGDARFPVMAGIASMIVILAGGSWLFAVHLGWGLIGIWIAYIADEWCRGLLMWARWRSRAWVPHLKVAVRKLKRAERGAGDAV